MCSSDLHLIALGQLDEAANELARLSNETKMLGHEPDSALRLLLAEVDLRRGELRDADLELRAIAAEGLDELGRRRFEYHLLRSLVDLRRGELEPAQLERLHAEWKQQPYSQAQLEDWLVELELSAAERRRLEP